MNAEYLNTLPEVANRWGVELEDGEKVVFAAKLNVFGTEKDRMLGTDKSNFTLTNRRIIANNTIATWTVGISEDVASWGSATTGKFIFKSTIFRVLLNDEMEYDYGKAKLNGFNFYLKGSDLSKLLEITNKA